MPFMRILEARNAAGNGESRSEKPSKNIHANALSHNGEFAGNTDQDARDMYKLGVQQETKVSTFEFSERERVG